MAERKTKAPDDPTIFVGGKPKIDINANKLQINEFLKRHKVIKPSQGGKRKSLTQLRQELIDGGHVVGVKGKTGTTKTKGGGARKQGEEDKKKQEEYKKILAANPQGFNVKNVNPIGFTIKGFNTPIDAYKPTTEEIFSSGYGGIPISNPASSVSSPRLELQEDYLKTPSEMRDYLTSRVPVDDFRNLRKAELRELYNKVRESRGEEEDYSEGKSVSEMRDELAQFGVNTEGLTKRELRIRFNEMVAKNFASTDTTDYSKGERIKDMRDYLSSRIPNTVFKDMRKGEIRQLYNREKRIENRQVPEQQIEDEPDTDTEEEDVGLPELVSFEGIIYQELNDKLYDMRGNYVGVWNVDFDDIKFTASGKRNHEKDYIKDQYGAYNPPAQKHPITKELVDEEQEAKVLKDAPEQELTDSEDEIDDADLALEEFEDSEEERQLDLFEAEQKAEDERRKAEAAKMKEEEIEKLINIAAREQPGGGKYQYIEMMRAYMKLLDAGIRVPTPERAYGNLGRPGNYPIPDTPKGRERR